MIIIITVDSCANKYLVVANDIWNQWKPHITQFFWWNWFIFDPLNFSSVVSVLHSSLNDLQVNMCDLSVRQSIITTPDKIIHFRHFCFSKTVKALVRIKNNLLFTQNTDTSFWDEGVCPSYRDVWLKGLKKGNIKGPTLHVGVHFAEIPWKQIKKGRD